ncbi:head completion/stabilization protein [Yersinia ruckeri]|uniref:head completion/stabilization protein n=1 Tax=Yersinia ruckeri TaxID=29486 RepID=UPI002237FF0C|nr:head completion/stabilization protein [Yersinia ruckeri]MCW6540290.1 head completion/stabilization protein [Yersinia ruckeri]
MTTIIIPAPESSTNKPGIVIPVSEQREPVIKNTYFWPDIDPVCIRELMRLEYVVTPERLREAIRMGIAETNAELYLFRERNIAAGFSCLAEVPAERIDGESEKCFHYLRAVSAFASASVYERYRGYDASAKGDKKADATENTADTLWRDARWAVSRLQGRPRAIIGQI